MWKIQAADKETFNASVGRSNVIFVYRKFPWLTWYAGDSFASNIIKFFKKVCKCECKCMSK